MSGTRLSVLCYFLCFLAAMVFFCLFSTALAGTLFWNVTSGEWSTPSNWREMKAPTAVDYVYIINGGTAAITNWGETCSDLYLGGPNTGTIQMTDGSLSLKSAYVGYSGTGSFINSAGINIINNGSLRIGFGSNSTGTYVLSGTGHLQAPKEYIGAGGTGTFIHSAGINIIPYSYDNGLYIGLSSIENGTYVLCGTAQLLAPYEYVGFLGPGTLIHSAGTNTCSNIYLGYKDNHRGNGTYTLNGTGQLSTIDQYIGYLGMGDFNHSAGTNIVSNNLYLGFSTDFYYGSGTYNLSGTGQLIAANEYIGFSGTSYDWTYYGQGIFNQYGGTNITNQLIIGGSRSSYNFTGGKLILKSILAYTNPNIPAFNFGGGTLQASGSFTTTLPMTLTGINGDANIDTADYSVTLSGVLSGAGGLFKRGAGMLTLSGSNTYKGQTDIYAGSLKINGSLDPSSLVFVNNSGTLRGSGTVGRVIANAGSHIAPGDSAGVLSLLGNLTLNSGALLDFDLDAIDTSDKISMPGSTLFLNNQQFSDFTFSPLSGFAVGTYTLIDAGSIQGSLGANLTGDINSLPASLSLSTLGDDLILTVVPEPATIEMLSVCAFILLGCVWRKKTLNQLAFCLIAMPALGAGVARADVFNMPAGLTSLEFVTVGNPGNAGELTGVGGVGWDHICGAVDYTYQIGKYEITAGQYAEFLNKVGGIDTYGLYNTNMSRTDYGCGITRSGSGTVDNPYTYFVSADFFNRPVNYVSWGDAARFTNWLHNNQPTGVQDLSTTEDGAYYLNGVTNDIDLMEVGIRKTGAKYWIPSENEWYKAAYYKGSSTNAGYWLYPTQSNTPPGRNISEATNSSNNANFYGIPYPIDSGHYTTLVGEFQLSVSAYGTFDQGGNVWEWNELKWNETDGIGPWRGLRGGSFNSHSDDLASYYQFFGRPAGESGLSGFRVASIPEPGGIILLGTGAVGFLGAIFLRGRKIIFS